MTNIVFRTVRSYAIASALGTIHGHVCSPKHIAWRFAQPRAVLAIRTTRPQARNSSKGVCADIFEKVAATTG
jgi:hypothetical protein